MTQLESLKQQASRIGAIIYCPQCSHEEPFENYLDRDNRVDELNETVHFGCPECPSDSVDLGKREGGARNVIVHGIEEMEQLAGE